MSIRILLINDHPSLTTPIRDLLAPRGYSIDEASEPGRALDLLGDRHYDIIIMETTLTGTGGTDVLEYLQTHSRSSSVIFITGAGMPVQPQEGPVPGNWDFIEAPYHSDSLLRIIDHILADESRFGHRLHIVKANEFIKSTPTGDLDMSASRLAFTRIAAAGAAMEGYTVMLDLREVRFRLSTANIYQLAEELTKYGDTFLRRTAVLTRDDKTFTESEFFETVSHNRGFNVKVFTDFEEAMAWLSDITAIPNYSIV